MNVGYSRGSVGPSGSTTTPSSPSTPAASTAPGISTQRPYRGILASFLEAEEDKLLRENVRQSLLNNPKLLNRLVEEALMSTVMTRQEALSQATRLIQAGFPTTVRPRTWAGDKGKDYWAVEAQAPGFDNFTKLYSTADVTRFIEAHTPPIDVVASVTSNYGFRFDVEGGAIPSPSQQRATYFNSPTNYVWSLQDIRAVRGLVAFNGKKYKLLPPANLFNHVESPAAAAAQ